MTRSTDQTPVQARAMSQASREMGLVKPIPAVLIAVALIAALVGAVAMVLPAGALAHITADSVFYALAGVVAVYVVVSALR